MTASQAARPARSARAEPSRPNARISQDQIRSPSLSRKKVTNSMSTTPARISTAISPPVTTVPATTVLCWLR